MNWRKPIAGRTAGGTSLEPFTNNLEPNSPDLDGWAPVLVLMNCDRSATQPNL